MLAVIPMVIYAAGGMIMAEDRSSGDPRYAWYGLLIMTVGVALMWAMLPVISRLARTTIGEEVE